MFFLMEYVSQRIRRFLTLEFLHLLQAGSKHFTPTACQPVTGALAFKEKSSLLGPVPQGAFQQ